MTCCHALPADTAVLQALAGSALSQWLRSAVLLVGAFAMLVATSPALSLVVVAVVPVVVVPLVLFSRRERALSRVAQERVADLAALAEETISALRTVQAFNHEPQARARFAQVTERAVAAARARIRSRALVIGGVILLGFGAITLSLWVGGREVLAGRMTAGALSAFVFYAVIVATSGAGLSELWGELQRAAGAADRVAELMSVRPTIATPALPRALPIPPVGRIAFEGGGFHLCCARRTAGAARLLARGDAWRDSGPGRSVRRRENHGIPAPAALPRPLGRHRPPGRHRPARRTSLCGARPALGWWRRSPWCSAQDVWTNLRFGRPGATDAEVRDAAAAASCEFLDALPQGYDTFLGERGVRLSGGQRQRLAIARAILRDAPILLLDEATSALDSESEAAVQRALAKLASRTTLVIAHRLATVRRADRIVVMEAGRIVATGTHDVLVGQGGLYARLAALQFDASLPRS